MAISKQVTQPLRVADGASFADLRAFKGLMARLKAPVLEIVWEMIIAFCWEPTILVRLLLIAKSHVL